MCPMFLTILSFSTFLLDQVATIWLELCFKDTYDKSRMLGFAVMSVLMILITFYGATFCILFTSFPWEVSISLLSLPNICSELLNLIGTRNVFEDIHVAKKQQHDGLLQAIYTT